VLKNFVLTERFRLKFGADIFNLFNRHYWQKLQADINNLSTFGRYTAASVPRTMQMHLKLEF
jgi:outer membrane receptor for Fe3+-dicitrate